MKITAEKKADLDVLPLSAGERERLLAAADLLIGHGARRVVLFGSLARGRKPTVHSDYDFAVEGLPRECFLECLGELLQQLPRPVDLVEWETAPDFLRSRIEREGVVIKSNEN